MHFRFFFTLPYNKNALISTDSPDEDAFRRGIGSPLDETRDTSDSVDGIVDQEEAIIVLHGVHCLGTGYWSIML
jgi:hypothetical protein